MLSTFPKVFHVAMMQNNKQFSMTLCMILDNTWSFSMYLHVILNNTWIYQYRPIKHSLSIQFVSEMETIETILNIGKCSHSALHLARPHQFTMVLKNGIHHVMSLGVITMKNQFDASKW